MPKRYNHLYETLMSEENILRSIKQAAKGHMNDVAMHERVDFVRTRAIHVCEIVENAEYYVSFYQNYVENYVPVHREPTTIYDGISRKKRQIIVPNYHEKVMHYMIVNTLEPIIRKGMYFHANGSIPGTGSVRGKRHIEKWIRTDPRNTKYYLKLDIKNFFGSIDHEKLMEYAQQRIKDKRFLRILEQSLSVTSIGLPLGFHTSHWLANWYLQDLDHYIKEELGAKYMERYMDDMALFGSNKRNLHYFRIAIEEKLNEKGLRLKENWQVNRFIYTTRAGKTFGQFLDFMGFRFYKNRTTIRRNTMLKMTRRALRISKKDKPTIHDCRSMLSALGIIKHTDSYEMYLKHIKPNIDFGRMKRYISRYDRQHNLEQRKAA